MFAKYLKCKVVGNRNISVEMRLQIWKKKKKIKVEQ